MKEFIKRVIPAPLISKAVMVKNRIDLNRISKISFNTTNLPGPINLKEIWQNPESDKRWEIAHCKITQHVNDTDMWGGINPGDRRALYYLITALKPKRVLEVGTHIGASTLYIAHALKQLSDGGKVTTVDIIDVNSDTGPWRDSVLDQPPAALAANLKCAEYITFQTGNSLDFMKETPEQFDLIFLDGDHSAKTVYLEVSAALACLTPFGQILLHDYYPGGKPLFQNNASISGPYLALERIKKENPAIDVFSLGELPWPTKEGTKKTSLALVART